MFIIPANSASAAGGFNVDNSCRFNSGSSDNLQKTPSGDGNKKTFTVSTWVKRSNISSHKNIWSAGQYQSTAMVQVFFESDDTIHVSQFNAGGGQQARLTTNRLFRDVSAWYHIVAVWDTAQSTNTNRLKLYVNGVQETSFSTSAYPDQNDNTGANTNNIPITIGNRHGSSLFFSGYQCECVLLDGTATAITDLGEFDEDSGIWKPIDVSGLTFGTNGYYLDFKDASNLGNDANGGTDFTENNLTAVDQSTDTCTTNFATMNPLDNFYAGGTFAEGNLQVTTRNTGYSYNTSTFGLATGKWYWEVKWSAQNTGSTNQVQIGIAKRVSASSTTWLGSVAYTYGYQGASGHVQNNDGNASGSVATTYSVGDIISVAMDLDNNKIHFAKNGTYTNSSNPATNSGGVTITAPDSTSEDSGFYFPAFGDGNNNLVETGQFNFGSPPYAISSGNQDADGFGNFEYAVPSGYFALNTKNLAEYG